MWWNNSLEHSCLPPTADPLTVHLPRALQAEMPVIFPPTFAAPQLVLLAAAAAASAAAVAAARRRAAPREDRDRLRQWVVSDTGWLVHSETA